MTIRKHALGFWEIPVLKWRNYEILLHAYTSANLEDIHGHRWDFTSVVLLGKLREQRWEMAAGASYDMFLVTPAAPEVAVKINSTPVRQTDARQIRNVMRRAPCVYQIRARELHNITANRALTLFIKIRRPDSPATVVVLRKRETLTSGGATTGPADD